MRKEFREKYKKEAAEYLKKCVSNLKKDHPGKAAATLKRMGAQPGDCVEGSSFTLLSHLRENLTGPSGRGGFCGTAQQRQTYDNK